MHHRLEQLHMDELVNVSNTPAWNVVVFHLSGITVSTSMISISEILICGSPLWYQHCRSGFLFLSFALSSPSFSFSSLSGIQIHPCSFVLALQWFQNSCVLFLVHSVVIIWPPVTSATLCLCCAFLWVFQNFCFGLEFQPFPSSAKEKEPWRRNKQLCRKSCLWSARTCDKSKNHPAWA